MRDRIMANWRFSEPALANVLPVNFGSGYPSDPICKAWLQDNLSNNVFGFADVVRFSWGPVKKQLTNNDSTAVAVTFLADDEAKEDVSGDGENKHLVLLGKKRQQDQMCAFLSGKQQHQKRLPYFEERKLEIVTKLP